MSVWRHLTHPDGMTVSLLATATGLSAEQVRADDVRDACANAVSVFAEETNAGQCREVAEYMREVLLAQIARRQETPQ